MPEDIDPEEIGWLDPEDLDGAMQRALHEDTCREALWLCVVRLLEEGYRHLDVMRGLAAAQSDLADDLEDAVEIDYPES